MLLRFRWFPQELFFANLLSCFPRSGGVRGRSAGHPWTLVMQNEVKGPQTRPIAFGNPGIWVPQEEPTPDRERSPFHTQILRCRSGGRDRRQEFAQESEISTEQDAKSFRRGIPEFAASTLLDSDMRNPGLRPGRTAGRGSRQARYYMGCVRLWGVSKTLRPSG